MRFYERTVHIAVGRLIFFALHKIDYFNLSTVLDVLVCKVSRNLIFMRGHDDLFVAEIVAQKFHKRRHIDVIHCLHWVIYEYGRESPGVDAV
ncbi:hypothetical protein D3C79_873280 [compost metagenome]